MSSRDRGLATCAPWRSRGIVAGANSIGCGGCLRGVCAKATGAGRDGNGARCVRKSSCVRGSPPETEISGGGASPPKTGISGEGASPPKPTPGTGQEGVVNPQARMR